MGIDIKGKGLRIRRTHSLSCFGPHAANEMANCQYNMLPRRASGPYRVLGVQPHTVTTENDEIPKTVSIDCVTLSPTRAQMIDILQERHK